MTAELIDMVQYAVQQMPTHTALCMIPHDLYMVGVYDLDQCQLRAHIPSVPDYDIYAMNYFLDAVIEYK